MTPHKPLYVSATGLPLSLADIAVIVGAGLAIYVSFGDR